MLSSLLDFVLFSTIITCNAMTTKDNNMVINTNNGRVEGHLVRYDNYRYITFLGIPYAAAMIGNNRFKAPLPAKPWSGILRANRKVMCPQSGKGDENCLVVNVFTPKKINKILLPVIVHIHSGAFYANDGGHKGEEHLVRQQIIVVGMNYRLGPLGFLCLKTKDAPGNAGLKDIVAALKWVQRNIAKFGGDPDRVTIFGGSSAGATLFQGAVMEGGSALNTWAIDHNPIATAKAYKKYMKYPKDLNDTDRLAAFYRKQDAIDLTKHSENFIDTRWTRYQAFGFVPCVEEPLDGTEAFLTEDPLDILKKEQYAKVPMILSFSSFEGLNSIGNRCAKLKPTLARGFYDFLPTDLVLDTKNKELIAGKVNKLYFNGSIDKEQGCYNYFGDILFTYGTIQSARLHSNHATVYLMKFVSGTSIIKSYKGEAVHGSFEIHTFPSRDTANQDDKLVIKKATTLTGNFVKYGNPTPDKTNPLIPVEWPPLTPGQPMLYLSLDKEITIMKDPFAERMALWSTIYKLNGAKKKGNENAFDPLQNIIS